MERKLTINKLVKLASGKGVPGRNSAQTGLTAPIYFKQLELSKRNYGDPVFNPSQTGAGIQSKSDRPAVMHWRPGQLPIVGG